VPINSTRYRWSELDGEQRAELNQEIVDLTEAFWMTSPTCKPGNLRRDHAGRLPAASVPALLQPGLCQAVRGRFPTVTWKLTDPEAVHNCANQAEELALYALIQATRDALPAGEDDLAAFEETVCEDNDFLLLFDPSKDGIAEALAPALPDLTAFHVKDWFEPFNEHDRPVHPYQLLAPRPVAGRSGPSASD
jgi:hypothetical protein